MQGIYKGDGNLSTSLSPGLHVYSLMYNQEGNTDRKHHKNVFLSLTLVIGLETWFFIWLW